MLIETRKVRVLLLLTAAAFLLSGILFLVGREDLPYGHHAPLVMWLSALAAAAPLMLSLRLHVLARKLKSVRALGCRAGELPSRKGYVYMGEGFIWGPRQTCLLQDLASGKIEPLAREVDSLSGDWLMHGLGADRTGDLFLPENLLNQHIFLMGAPGSGKTRGLELHIEQAVARGEPLVVIDPKGDEGLLDRAYDAAVRNGRGDAFRVLALPYPYRSARYNPLGDFVSPSDIADRIASILPRGGDNEPFRNYAWDFVHNVARALHLTGDVITLAKLDMYIFHSTWTLVRRMLRKTCPRVAQKDDIHETLDGYRKHCSVSREIHPELDALIAMASLDEKYFSKIAGTLRTILSKLTSRTVGYLLSPDDIAPPEGIDVSAGSSLLSWGLIERQRLVVYFYLGALIGQDTASATARMTLADLASYVGKKYAFEDGEKLRDNRLTVVVDEVADAVSAESIQILNKARGAGLSLVMAGQSLADLEVALGDRASARRALANVGTFVTFRAANPEDAAYFSEKVGVRPLPVVSRGERYEPALFSSGRSNIADFAYASSTTVSSRNEPLLPTAALDRLAQFHYFGLWGGEVRKGLLPQFDPPKHRFAPSLKRAIPISAAQAAPPVPPTSSEIPRDERPAA